MTEKEFKSLESLNARIDVWIDQEEYDKVEKTCEVSDEFAQDLSDAFEDEGCTSKSYKAWTNLLRKSDQFPITKVFFNDKAFSLADSWTHFFFAKLIRAKIQSKGTDCYFRKLDDVVTYLERNLPSISRNDPDSSVLCAIYMLEMSASGIGADQRSFAERSQRILREYVRQPEYQDLVNFYNLWARYNIGVGYFHDCEYRKAVLEFNEIIFSFIKNTPNRNDFESNCRLLYGRELLYTPSVLYRADIQLKLQLAYHALKTLEDHFKDGNEYKKAKANLIRAEAYQQMGLRKDSQRMLKRVHVFVSGGNQLTITDIQNFLSNSQSGRENLKGRLRALLTAECLTILKDGQKEIDLENMSNFFTNYYSSVALQKPKRIGYFEQMAEYLEWLVKQSDLETTGSIYEEQAKKIYNGNRKYLLEKEPNNKLPVCPCKEKGIDLRRLPIEHYDTFNKSILKFYKKFIDHPNDKKQFIKRLNELEERSRENLDWRKRELQMYSINSASIGRKWCSTCVVAARSSGRTAFERLVYCEPCVNANNCKVMESTEDNFQLEASDYEWIMDAWDEHFLKHMEKFSVHEPKERSIHFLGLQRWNSTSPAQGRSLGGGYLIYHTDMKGSVDLGVAIDPGFDFVRNLFHAGFSLADIDVVVLSHAHLDHVRDFESMILLCSELNKRTSPKIKHKLHAIMTLGVYRQLEHLIESPGLREFVDPYIVDIEKEIEPDFLKNKCPCFTYTPDSTYLEGGRGPATSGSRFKPVLGQQSYTEDLCLSIVPTKAYHNDFSEYSDSFGFKISIRDGHIDQTFGYSGDTSWHDGVIEQYSDCDAILVHLGSLIDRQQKNKFENYETPQKCFELIRNKNHPYLMGMLRFVGEINRWDRQERSPLILISEFGEELRGRIRLDFVGRLKKACADAFDILPVDIGLDLRLIKISKDSQDTTGNSPHVYCIQCQKFVAISKIDFVTYGYDEALFGICTTCKKSTPQNVLSDSLRRLYEEGRELFVDDAKKNV